MKNKKATRFDELPLVDAVSPRVVIRSETVTSEPVEPLGRIVSIGPVISSESVPLPAVMTPSNHLMSPQGNLTSLGTISSPQVIIPQQGMTRALGTVRTMPGILTPQHTQSSTASILIPPGKVTVSVTTITSPISWMPLQTVPSHGHLTAGKAMSSVTRIMQSLTKDCNGLSTVRMPSSTITSSIVKSQAPVMSLGAMPSLGAMISPAPVKTVGTLTISTAVPSVGAVTILENVTPTAVSSYEHPMNACQQLSQQTQQGSNPFLTMTASQGQELDKAVAKENSVASDSVKRWPDLNCARAVAGKATEPAHLVTGSSISNTGQGQKTTTDIGNLPSVVSTEPEMHRFPTVWLTTAVGTQEFTVVLANVDGSKTTLYVPSTRASKDQTMYARKGHDLNIVSGEGIYPLFKFKGQSSEQVTPHSACLLAPKTCLKKTSNPKAIVVTPVTNIKQPIILPASKALSLSVSSAVSPIAGTLSSSKSVIANTMENCQDGTAIKTCKVLHPTVDVPFKDNAPVEKQDASITGSHVDRAISEETRMPLPTAYQVISELKPASDTTPRGILPNPSISAPSTNTTTSRDRKGDLLVPDGDGLGVRPIIIEPQVTPCVNTVQYVNTSPGTNGSNGIHKGFPLESLEDGLLPNSCLDKYDNFINNSTPVLSENDVALAVMQICDESDSALDMIENPEPDVLENDNEWNLGLKIDSVYSLADQTDLPESESEYASESKMCHLVPVQSEAYSDSGTDSANSDEPYYEIESDTVMAEDPYEDYEKPCMEHEIKGLFTISDDSDSDISASDVKEDLDYCIEDFAVEQIMKCSESVHNSSNENEELLVDTGQMKEGNENEGLQSSTNRDILDALLEDVLPEITMPDLPFQNSHCSIQSLQIKSSTDEKLKCLLCKSKLRSYVARKSCTQIAKHFKRKEHRETRLRRCSVLTPKLDEDDIELSRKFIEKQGCSCGAKWSVLKRAYDVQHDHSYSKEATSISEEIDYSDSTDTASSVGYDEYSLPDGGIRITGKTVLEVETVTLESVLADPALKNVLWKELEPTSHDVSMPMRLKISNVVSLCDIPIVEDQPLDDNKIFDESDVRMEYEPVSDSPERCYKFRPKQQRLHYNCITLEYIERFRENAKRLREQRVLTKKDDDLEKEAAHNRWKAQSRTLKQRKRKRRRLKKSTGHRHGENTNSSNPATIIARGHAKNSDVCSPTFCQSKYASPQTAGTECHDLKTTLYSAQTNRKKKVRSKRKKKSQAYNDTEKKLIPKIQMRIRRENNSEWIVFMGNDEPFVTSFESGDTTEDCFKEDFQKPFDPDTNRFNTEIHYDSTTHGTSHTDTLLRSEEISEKLNKSEENDFEMKDDRSDMTSQDVNTTKNLSRRVRVLCVDSHISGNSVSQKCKQDPQALLPLINSTNESINSSLPSISSPSDRTHLLKATSSEPASSSVPAHEVKAGKTDANDDCVRTDIKTLGSRTSYPGTITISDDVKASTIKCVSKELSTVSCHMSDVSVVSRTTDLESSEPRSDKAGMAKFYKATLSNSIGNSLTTVSALSNLTPKTSNQESRPQVENCTQSRQKSYNLNESFSNGWKLLSLRGTQEKVSEVAFKGKHGQLNGSGKRQLGNICSGDMVIDRTGETKTSGIKCSSGDSRRVNADNVFEEKCGRSQKQSVSLLTLQKDTVSHNTVQKRKRGRPSKVHLLGNDTLDFLRDASATDCSCKDNPIPQMCPHIDIDSDIDQPKRSKQRMESDDNLNASVSSTSSEKENCIRSKPCNEGLPAKPATLNVGLKEQADGLSGDIPNAVQIDPPGKPLNRIERLKAMLKKQEEDLVLVRQRREESKKILDNIDML